MVGALLADEPSCKRSLSLRRLPRQPPISLSFLLDKIASGKGHLFNIHRRLVEVVALSCTLATISHTSAPSESHREEGLLLCQSAPPVPKVVSETCGSQVYVTALHLTVFVQESLEPAGNPESGGRWSRGGGWARAVCLGVLGSAS